MNTSIYNNVPIMKQPLSGSCWYTCLQMVVAFYRNQGRGDGLTDPSEDPETQAMYTANKGIGSNPMDRERIARKLGFTAGFVSLSNEGMWQQLQDGPVIYAGQWPGFSSGHWVVIVGISDTSLAINNPLVGLQTWDYNYFMDQYLVQTADRPLVYAS